jgi:putative ABC transport system permease protein
LNEKTTSILLTIFAILAIFIGCIGLFGLAYFTIIQRTREIGIRKVVGASVFRIIGLINQDFLKLVFTASLIGTPIAWFMSYKWLQNYTYRIEVNWWLFLLPFLILAIITMLTVSYYTVKAALANPTRSLRQE